MTEQALKAVISKPIRVLGIAGSLRQASFNKGLLRYIEANRPSNIEFSIANLQDIPVFSQDIEDIKNESNNPESVQIFRKQVRECDAIVFATAEYNFSMSGVLKNSIDWASRGQFGNAFTGKTATLIGAGGGAGTSRAQYHLRQTAVFLNLNLLNVPEVQIPAFTQGTFNMENGDLLDQIWQERLIKQVERLRDYSYIIKLGETAFDQLKPN